MSELKRIMQAYDEAKDDTEFDSNHPIFKMAKDIDDKTDEIARLKTAMRVLAKCSDEDIANLKALCSRANNYMRLMDGEEFELDQSFGTLKDELHEAAK